MEKLMLYENSYLDGIQEIREFITLNACYGSSLIFSLLSLVFKGKFYKNDQSVVFGVNFAFLFFQVIFTVWLFVHSNRAMVDSLFALKGENYWSVGLSKFGFIKKYNSFINIMIFFSFVVNTLFLGFISYYEREACILYHLSPTEHDFVLLENLYSTNVVLRLLFFVTAITELCVFFRDWRSRHEQHEVIFEFPLGENLAVENAIKIVKNDSTERTLDLSKETLKFLQGTVFILSEKDYAVRTIFTSEEVQKIAVQCQSGQDELIYDGQTGKWCCRSLRV